MLISHEVPIAYLETSKSFNDYDYCLVHLCDGHPEYLNFYKESVANGREVLLDNSIFELGVAFDSDRFAQRIIEIGPTYYVVPDVLEDAQGTIDSWKNFVERYPTLPGLKIGVVQGKTFTELVQCYKFMAENADYIAISFDMSYYQITTDGVDKLHRQCWGRYEFIHKLIDCGVWDWTLPHHLLGCSLAKEFLKYRDFDSIRSCDTSNPVIGALDGNQYVRQIGLAGKSPTKLADLIKTEYDLDTSNLVWYNAMCFREIANNEVILPQGRNDVEYDTFGLD